jgi:hypothetical protein
VRMRVGMRYLDWHGRLCGMWVVRVCVHTRVRMVPGYPTTPRYAPPAAGGESDTRPPPPYTRGGEDTPPHGQRHRIHADLEGVLLLRVGIR